MPTPSIPSPALELSRQLHRILARNLQVAGRDLRIDVSERGVVLSGTVRSWYHKQLAQESIRRLAGEASIRNEIEVVTD
jgi:osmotically-inducible protein OsmY